MTREKTFENYLYVPSGFARKINPITNADLQNLSIDLMNKTSSKCIMKGGIEVSAEEITKEGFHSHNQNGIFA